MSQIQAWADRPAGAIPDHVIKGLFKQATEDAILMAAANVVNVEGGESFTIPVISALDEPTDASLDELQPIPLDKLTVTSTEINESEEGRGVLIARKDLRRYRDVVDLIEQNKQALVNQQAGRLDTVIANALDDMVYKYVATGVASQNIAPTTPGAAALTNVNVYHARKMSTYMRKTLLVPKRGFGGYLGYFGTTGINSLKDDPQAELWFQRMPEVLKMMGFDGIVEGIAFKEVVHDNALDDTIGTNSDVAEGFVVGADAVFFGIISSPEIHTEWRDLNRFYAAGWHGDFGAGLPSTSATAGYPRGMHFTST